jgi:hypothetical protein
MNAREGRKSSTSHRQRVRAYIRPLLLPHRLWGGAPSEIGVLILKLRDPLVRAEPRNQAIGGRPKQEVVVVVLVLHRGEGLGLCARILGTPKETDTVQDGFQPRNERDESPTVVHPPANQTRSHIVCALHTLRPCPPGTDS